MHASPDLLALLALGEQVGEPDEHAHLSGCAQCRAELADLTAVVRMGRSVTDADVLHSPPPAVWSRIQAEIAEPAATVVDLDDVRASRRPRRFLAVAVAALLALVVGLGGGLAISRTLQTSQSADPQVHLNALPRWPGAAGEAELQTDPTGHRYLVVHLIAPAKTSGTEEVWLSNESATDMRSMGYLRDNTGRFEIPAGMNLKNYPVIDVSSEPVNDTDPDHSGNSIVRGRLVR